MALTKTIELNSGVSASYWRVSGLLWEDGIGGRILLQGFRDIDARKEGKVPLTAATIDIPAEYVKSRADVQFPTKSELYQVLLSLDGWKDAIPSEASLELVE